MPRAGLPAGWDGGLWAWAHQNSLCGRVRTVPVPSARTWGGSSAPDCGLPSEAPWGDQSPRLGDSGPMKSSNAASRTELVQGGHCPGRGQRGEGQGCGEVCPCGCSGWWGQKSGCGRQGDNRTHSMVYSQCRQLFQEAAAEERDMEARGHGSQA